jgi:phosphatidylglycerol:prolipoprotein diacylglycerol transferase
LFRLQIFVAFVLSRQPLNSIGDFDLISAPRHAAGTSIRATMNGTLLHTAFDALAWLAAGLSLLWLTRGAKVRFPASPAGDWHYLAALLFGTGIGAFLFGTANLWLSHQSGIARSVEGAILGGIVAVELYKHSAGIATRTGARFALPLAVGVATGRIGCYFAGLDDFTYGTPTTLPWGHDFGDGVPRHPAPLYESASMALFLVVYLPAAIRDNRYVIENGLYLAILWYAIQRFAWEFVKPYAAVVGPLTIFQILSILLATYAVAMLLTTEGTPNERAVHA